MQNELSRSQIESIFSLISKTWKTEKDELTLEERLFDKGGPCRRMEGRIEGGIREEYDGWQVKAWKPQV